MHMFSILVSSNVYVVIVVIAMVAILVGVYLFVYDDVSNAPEDDDDIDTMPPSNE